MARTNNYFLMTQARIGVFNTGGAVGKRLIKIMNTTKGTKLDAYLKIYFYAAEMFYDYVVGIIPPCYSNMLPQLFSKFH